MIVNRLAPVCMCVCGQDSVIGTHTAPVSDAQHTLRRSCVNATGLVAMPTTATDQRCTCKCDVILHLAVEFSSRWCHCPN